MNYRGYEITPDHGHYFVNGPFGRWAADTIEDAKIDIDIDLLEEEQDESDI